MANTATTLKNADIIAKFPELVAQQHPFVYAHGDITVGKDKTTRWQQVYIAQMQGNAGYLAKQARNWDGYVVRCMINCLADNVSKPDSMFALNAVLAPNPTMGVVVVRIIAIDTLVKPYKDAKPSQESVLQPDGSKAKMLRQFDGKFIYQTRELEAIEMVRNELGGFAKDTTGEHILTESRAVKILANGHAPLTNLVGAIDGNVSKQFSELIQNNSIETQLDELDEQIEATKAIIANPATNTRNLKKAKKALEEFEAKLAELEAFEEI
jgi:hypothetical protein